MRISDCQKNKETHLIFLYSLLSTDGPANIWASKQNTKNTINTINTGLHN